MCIFFFFFESQMGFWVFWVSEALHTYVIYFCIEKVRFCNILTFIVYNIYVDRNKMALDLVFSTI